MNEIVAFLILSAVSILAICHARKIESMPRRAVFDISIGITWALWICIRSGVLVIR